MRADSTSLPRFGRPPLPRLRLRNEFILTVRESALPMAQIALICGCRYPQRFSRLISADSVPITSRKLFESVARVVGYPPSQIFFEPRPAQNAQPSREAVA